MIGKFKLQLMLLLILSTSAVARPGFGVESLSGVTCNAHGDCSGVLRFDGKTGQPLCEESVAILAWKNKVTGALLTCNSLGTTEDKNSYFISSNKVTKLTYGRFMRKDVLFSRPDMSIPDKFSAKPLCSPAEIGKLKLADFILLEKQPGENGYCYDVTYLKVRDDVVDIELNKGMVDPGDSRYFSTRLKKDEVDAARRILSVLKAWKSEGESK